MLSLLPEMGQISRINQTFQWYHDASNRHLYLWKRHSNNWLGLIGVEVRPKLIIIRQLVLVPEINDRSLSYFQMLDDLRQRYSKQRFMGDFETTAICQVWERSHSVGKWWTKRSFK